MCVHSVFSLGHTSAFSLNLTLTLCSPPSRGNTMEVYCSRHSLFFKMKTICVLYRPGQCGSAYPTRQAAVQRSESDDLIVCVYMPKNHWHADDLKMIRLRGLVILHSSSSVLGS